MAFTADSPLSDVGPEGMFNDDLKDERQDERQDEFLGALSALGGSAGNGRLRDLLEWNEPTYDAAQAQLLSRGLIVTGRGRDDP